MIKKRVIVVVVIACICIALGAAILKDKYEISYMADVYKEDVQGYLTEKYEEEMWLTGDWSYYDAVYRYAVYPVENEELLFRAEYQINKRKCDDDYLETFAQVEAQEIVQNITQNYFANSSCKVSIISNIDDKEKLREFYVRNGVPWNCNSDNNFRSMRWLIIHIFDKSDVEADTIDEMLGDMTSCNFTFDDVTVKVFESDTAEKLIKEIRFKLTSEGYVEQL